MIKPYTYRLKWTNLNLSYYGVRLKPKADSDLWVHYFSSSYRVKLLREEYGDPDIIEIRKTFENIPSAIEWESRVLKRLKVRKNHKWLNNYDGKLGGSTKPLTERHKRNISMGLTGKQHPWQDKINKNLDKIRKTADSHIGRKRPPSTRQKQSDRKKAFIAENGGPPNKGMKQYFNPNTNETGLCEINSQPDGWVLGQPKMKGRKCFWDGINPDVVKRFFPGEEPEGWINGNPKNPGLRK